MQLGSIVGHTGNRVGEGEAELLGIGGGKGRVQTGGGQGGEVSDDIKLSVEQIAGIDVVGSTKAGVHNEGIAGFIQVDGEETPGAGSCEGDGVERNIGLIYDDVRVTGVGDDTVDGSIQDGGFRWHRTEAAADRCSSHVGSPGGGIEQVEVSAQSVLKVRCDGVCDGVAGQDMISPGGA
ncbi:MAG: hypothetical protein BWY72_01455 [Bacteroidetes bacterium ADurb.Bin416]|nr:MAG: hypothetical protein BWY72_01455 [Bacteroidetes bacterium ADurb.Bin416]